MTARRAVIAALLRNQRADTLGLQRPKFRNAIALASLVYCAGPKEKGRSNGKNEIGAPASGITAKGKS